MFAPWCPTCRSRILLGPRRLERLDQTPDGPVATLRCFCGTAVTWPEDRYRASCPERRLAEVGAAR